MGSGVGEKLTELAPKLKTEVQIPETIQARLKDSGTNTGSSGKAVSTQLLSHLSSIAFYFLLVSLKMKSSIINH